MGGKRQYIKTDVERPLSQSMAVNIKKVKTKDGVFFCETDAEMHYKFNGKNWYKLNSANEYVSLREHQVPDEVILAYKHNIIIQRKRLR